MFIFSSGGKCVVSNTKDQNHKKEKRTNLTTMHKNLNVLTFKNFLGRIFEKDEKL